VVKTALQVSGTHLLEAAPKFGNLLYIHGMVALSQGFILTSMIYAAIVVFMIEKKLKTAAGWALAASAFSFFGVIHAYTLSPAGEQNLFGLNVAPEFSAAYLLTAVILWVLSKRSWATWQ
jgi:AGZA family xanthine/uracil permease-like MFS transporter